jgi:hypothetical protein
MPVASTPRRVRNGNRTASMMPRSSNWAPMLKIPSHPNRMSATTIAQYAPAFMAVP